MAETITKEAETITKENDYTLSISLNKEAEIRDLENVAAPVRTQSSYTRLFNFAAGQITTISTTAVFQSRNHAQAAGSAAVSKQMHIQNFTDLPFTGELEILHKKLVEMDGHPPPLEDVLNGRSKRPLNKIFHKS